MCTLEFLKQLDEMRFYQESCKPTECFRLDHTKATALHVSMYPGRKEGFPPFGEIPLCRVPRDRPVIMLARPKPALRRTLGHNYLNFGLRRAFKPRAGHSQAFPTPGHWAFTEAPLEKAIKRVHKHTEYVLWI
jgi:hypothetical protein